MALYEELIVGELYALNKLKANKGIDFEVGGINVLQAQQTLADDAEYALPAGAEGFALVSDGTEYLVVYIAANGAVTAIVASANADVADTDLKLCVYDSGAGASVKNRLGAEATVSILFFMFK